ncbi:hypothetical protein UFOVP898_64 [uncultured Caudovirales phage]|uniref:Uncharacterized protein n=1 Tax=uncultured Caudovirales phage TaxID=2100421 RepID=A0A6J7X8H5_9CAUD|nr:hypothetical protein UFOVP898_64 [uncultured Caudovirales phage]CAB4176860.1 hypothetical protein UFOVP985_69 [uncultured Caudovirales phage]CAB4181785.1 hypothetical protein UFOVP1073_62 [uncultured Caudovirales phage]CAB4197699.1 hypothetical protein UFOVP1308_27 [uncultured Caudovirales phage]CAB4210725.1 hypothetical protein UFOVP1423_42 [uncultured Caudovirales phage]
MTFNQLVKEFMAVCEKRRNYGAVDTEPQEVFRTLIRRVIRGYLFTMPTTAEDWQLYSSTMSCEEVAKEMTAAALPCVEAAKQAAQVYEFLAD